MCFSVAEGLEMKAAADAAGVTLMVAYPKRYDPAFERFREVAVNVAEPRLMRVTTFESPFLPYIGHYSLAPVAPIPKDAIATFRAETQASITRAIGEATPFLREEYHLVLLDTLVHELNTVRGVLGEPTSLEYVDMQPGQLTVILKFGDLSVAINWMDLPGYHPVRNGVRTLRPAAAGDPELPVAVPAQRTGDRRDHRGRSRHHQVAQHQRDHLV